MPNGYSDSDTIVAVSSPPGRSPRGLVRLSGPDAHVVACKLVHDAEWTPRHATVARLRDIGLPALVTLLDAPRTYTSQPMAELQCPGNPALLDRLLHHAIDLGARLAEPGEFTFAAFLAGKLDLTQAEGVAATIAATSDAQLDAAEHLRDGQLGRFAADLVDRLATALALVEAGIDFTDEEDVVPISPADLNERLQTIDEQLRGLLSRSRSWGTLEALPRVVLAGPPSAGKSTLFNALLGRTRAVIDPSPGTTRDALAEPLPLTGATGQRVEVMLVDIAGLDDPRSALDAQAQAAARRAIESADLVLELRDGDDDDETAPLVSTTHRAPTIRLRTKADLTPGDDTAAADLHVSAWTGQGLDELRALIAQRVGQRGVSVSGESLALQPRHESTLRAALDGLTQARDQLAGQLDGRAIAGVETIAGALRNALDALADLGGQMTPDDVIGRVFATFCIGK